MLKSKWASVHKQVTKLRIQDIVILRALTLNIPRLIPRLAYTGAEFDVASIGVVLVYSLIYVCIYVRGDRISAEYRPQSIITK